MPTRSGLRYAANVRYVRRARRLGRARGLISYGKALRYGGYGLAAYAAVGLTRGVAWKLRKTARARAWRARRQHRGVRHTHTSIQEVHRFENEIAGTVINHILHPFGTFTDAPMLKPMKNIQGEKFDIRLDLTRHMFEDAGAIDPNACKIDIAGIAIDIELVNKDIFNDIYVRTAITRLKNIHHDTNITESTGEGSIDDEYFQDPHDKCKRWDFDAALDHKKYTDDAKIRMKINRANHAVYHDRVILLGRKPDDNGLTPIVQKGYDKNRRKMAIRWFPKGGYRMEILHDGDTKKSWMNTRLCFRMWAIRKKILGHYESWVAEPIDYKIRIKVYYRKVT